MGKLDKRGLAMKRPWVVCLAPLLLLSSSAWAQSEQPAGGFGPGGAPSGPAAKSGSAQSAQRATPQVRMDLPLLEEKADEVLSVNLEGESLGMGQKLLAVRNGVSKSVKELIKGLKGVYLRRFWFSRKKAYSAEDTEPIRKQLEGGGWVPMIDVRDRQNSESVTVYSYVENKEVTGITIVSEEAHEFTVVNIVGPVDLEALSELGEQMGMPVMKLATRELIKEKVFTQPGEVPPNN